MALSLAFHLLSELVEVGSELFLAFTLRFCSGRLIRLVLLVTFSAFYMLMLNDS